jgi:cold shock CspA family protein
MASGTVEWFTDASEYDFVVSDEIGGDLCARGSNVDAAMGTRLTEGDRAEFQARVAGMRPEAIEVLPLRARQDLRCACGYGIVASGPLPACPMCGTSAWSLRKAAAAKKSLSGAL